MILGILKTLVDKMGGYDVVDDPKAYMKGKRKRRMVILHDSLLPLKCAKCGKPINKEDGNRTDIYPKQKLVVPYHYMCVWEKIFKGIDKLSDLYAWK